MKESLKSMLGMAIMAETMMQKPIIDETRKPPPVMPSAPWDKNKTKRRKANKMARKSRKINRQLSK